MALLAERSGDSLSLSGSLTSADVEQHWPIPAAWLGSQTLNLNLERLQQVDSAGLAWLIELESAQRQQQGTMQWLHCPERLIQLMTLYDLDVSAGQLAVRHQN
ncbi:STAS domain-containing protein [Ferrimonas senticii]|uniref:STAS domain-containing protein n=1 Tax=Ferrimonas senticii TaxID=394566 RepID=UPI000421D0E4|nr:STAS domain-containing protein [Ferrimonas senticii]